MKIFGCCMFAALIALFIACGGTDLNQQACKDIPAGGCPLSYGLACEDPSCASVYACNTDGTWTLDHTCPLNDASSSTTDSGSPDAGLFSRDADIDAPPGSYGGPGCPDLEEPDCPLGDALLCPSNADCCGCEDLYTCDNGGWDHWGVCDSTGVHPDN